MRKFIRIDDDGYFVEDVLVGDGDVITDPTLTDVPCPDGFYRPRFDGTGWVEGLKQEEIDAIRNAPSPKSPEQQRIEALEEENAFLAIELASTQARLDQAEQEQADLLLMLVAQGVI